MYVVNAVILLLLILEIAYYAIRLLLLLHDDIPGTQSHWVAYLVQYSTLPSCITGEYAISLSQAIKSNYSLQ